MLPRSMVYIGRKRLKKIGNGIGIYFNKEQQKLYNLEDNQIVDVDITLVNKKEVNKNEKTNCH